MANHSRQIYEFGPFRLDVGERLFLRNGETVPLTPKAFETLVVLVRNSGHLVDKDELLKQVWPDTFVEESNLSQHIYMLRKALGEDSSEHKYIETVPRRGYRFHAEVKELASTNGRPTPIEEPSPTPASESSTPAVAAAQEPAPERRWLPMLLLAAILIIAIAGVLLWKRSSSTAVASQRSGAIAVLPFTPLGAGDSDELLGLGMADATIIKLSTLQQIPVLPTSTVVRYTGEEVDPYEIGRELGVETVLTGTVQQDGERVRTSVQLISIKEGRAIWSGKFDEKFTDIFTLQDSISEQVAMALALEIGGQRQQLTKRYTQNPDAHAAYVRGIYFWSKRSEQSINRAVEYFQEAIRRDPNYALAHAALGDSYALLGFYGYGPLTREQAFESARAAAQKAIQLDESIPDAHSALALVKNFQDRDLAGAEREYARAIELNPSNATAQQRYGVFLMQRGRLDEAIEKIKRASELDPLAPVTHANHCYILFFQRKYDDAAKQCQQALEINPELVQPMAILGMIREQQGKYDDAITLFHKAQAVAKGVPSYAVMESLGHVYAVTGKTEDAKRILAELDKAKWRSDDAEYGKLGIYVGLGDLDNAFKVLDRRAPDWQEPPYELRLDPRFDALRADPRYQTFLKKHFDNA